MDFGVSDQLSEFNQGIKDLLVQMVKLGRDLKSKKEKEKKILSSAVRVYENRLESTTRQEDVATKEELQYLLGAKTARMEQLQRMSEAEDRLRHQVSEAEQKLSDTLKQSQESKKVPDCPSKYTVNLYRDVAKISWAKNVQGPHEVKGFSCSKSKAKSFHFNEKKQSEFFIANSLWALGDE